MPLRGEIAGRALTGREWQVLAELARVDTIKEVAARLGVRVHTVKSHLSRIFAKLEVTSRDGAFRAVGWLQPPGDEEVMVITIRARLVVELAGLRAEADDLLAMMRQPR